MTSDPLFYLAAFLAVTALGLSKGGFAGAGQVATPLMSLFMPPLQAAALLLPIQIVQDAISLWVYRRTWDAWNLKVMLPGSVLGVGLAWILAAHVSDAFVRVALGVLSIAFVLHAWLSRGPREKSRPTSAAGTFWGAFSGVTSAICQSGNPPFQAFVLPQQLDKLTYVGTSHDLLLGRERTQNRPLFRARSVHGRELHDHAGFDFRWRARPT